MANYGTGNVILASDYNGFVANVSANCINQILGTGSGDSGWGQATIANVSQAANVTALQWSSLVGNLSFVGAQTNVAITSRTAPVAGNTISVFANVQTDLNSLTLYRGNATSSGTISTTWTGNIAKTAATSAASGGWNITFTSTITFPSANQARYFWNAGGLIRIDMSKTSTGTDKDVDWNTFASTVGTLYLSGRVGNAAQTIAGVSYTGFTRSGGSGSPSPFASTTGWYNLTPGAAATTMFQLADTVSPYTGDYIQVNAAVDSTSTVLTLTTTWHDNGYSGAGKNNAISGGTDTPSPYTAFGTAPAVLVRWIPPSTSQGLSNSWGTISVVGSVV